MAKKLKYLVIHCTDTPAGREVSRADIEQWHLRERGWSRLGYSDLIHLDGRVENLTPYDDDDLVQQNEKTWGARGYNSVSRHVVYAGGKGTHQRYWDTRTLEQKESLAKYVKNFLFDYPHCKVVGHYQLDRAKECPSFDVPEWLYRIGVSPDNIVS